MTIIIITIQFYGQIYYFRSSKKLTRIKRQNLTIVIIGERCSAAKRTVFEKKVCERKEMILRKTSRTWKSNPRAIFVAAIFGFRKVSAVRRINRYYNDEFHITIGVVKLRMVRVDPGSWVVHVQHGVRLASALRAVAQG